MDSDIMPAGTAGRPPEGAPASRPERVVKASSGLILGTVVAAAAVWLFIWLADEVMRQATQQFDARVISYFFERTPLPLHRFMAGVTWAASGPAQAVVAVVAALYLVWRKRWWLEAITMLVAVFGGMLIDEGLKRIFHRVRPEPVFYHLGYSFPSGHSFSAVVAYGLLAYLVGRELPKRGRIAVWATAVLLMLLVGVSRVILAQHYPTDVLGGYLAGACWLWGCTVWLQALERRQSKPAVNPG